MPEFAEFQLKGKKLSERISGILKKSSQSTVGCMTFFQALSLDKDGVNDVQTISLVAESLDEKNNLALMHYLQESRVHSLLTYEEFMDFKVKALTGCYILKWRKCNLESGFNNKSLLDFFRKDLEIKTLSDWTDEYIDSCLVTFSDFCGFVFKHKASSVYSSLHEHLKDSIQVEIHNARFPTTSTSSILYEVLNTGMQAIGIKH